MMSRRQEQIETIGFLLDFWLDAPDLRLGQLWENLFGCGIHGGPKCVFYMTDEMLRDKIEVFKKICSLTSPRGDSYSK